MLTQARQAMDEGKFSLAEEFVQRAEKLNVKPDTLFEKYADSPAKVQAELAQRRAALNAATPPSAAFHTAWRGPAHEPGSSSAEQSLEWLSGGRNRQPDQ